jgi:hypothetical protein
MRLGDKTAAFAFVEKAITVNSIEKDSMDGPGSIEILARVSAKMGEPERAVGALQKLLSTPYESPLNAANVPLTPALSGSIRCSIRSAAIRASKNSPPRNRRKRVANEMTW